MTKELKQNWKLGIFVSRTKKSKFDRTVFVEKLQEKVFEMFIFCSFLKF